MKTLKIGTRVSSLALWQTDYVVRQITRYFPHISFKIQKIRTTGDRLSDRYLSEIGGKGVFVKEIEEALLNNDIDIAVHSLKDLPTVLPEGLSIGAFIQRHNPHDAFISVNNTDISELKKGDKVATGSLRRKSQLLLLYPHLDVVPIRGNVDTRIKKLSEGNLKGIVLSAAGLERLGLEMKITRVFSSHEIIPAPGQGVIAVEQRKDDHKTKEILSKINHEGTEITSVLERSFLKKLGGDCSIPAGCFAELSDNRVNAVGIIVTDDGESYVREKISGSPDTTVDLGYELADILLERGGRSIIDRYKIN